MNAIEIESLSLCFGDLLVIDNVSLTVELEEVVALIGPSGCGKSTLLRVVAGIIPKMIPATLRGKISVLGKEPKNLRAGELDMVFQENCLLPWRSAVLNICLGAEIIHDGSSSPIGLLEQVGLVGFEKALPKQLSGGMKQRVSLGASLITHPEILLMDEPFASLDALTKERLWQLMEDLRLRQLIHTGLIVTHSIEEAVVLSDRVLVMSPRPGKIIAEVVINLPKPRINQDGLFISGFGDICNQIRVHVRRGER